MEITLEWWHWVTAGLIIAMLEMAVPAFFMIWFGLGAILVGLLLAIFPFGLTAQILLWAFSSSVMTFCWFRFFKHTFLRKAGLSKDAFIGHVGLITKPVAEMVTGEIMFQRPILGSQRWAVIADEAIAAGERAHIVDVMGQLLKVSKATSNI